MKHYESTGHKLVHFYPYPPDFVLSLYSETRALGVYPSARTKNFVKGIIYTII